MGVIQAMRETGVPIDVVGGTSQGAFMAALFAQGLGIEEMRSRTRLFASKMSTRHLMLDLTLPILSVLSGRMFDRVRSGLAAVRHAQAA